MRYTNTVRAAILQALGVDVNRTPDNLHEYAARHQTLTRHSNLQQYLTDTTVDVDSIVTELVVNDRPTVSRDELDRVRQEALLQCVGHVAATANFERLGMKFRVNGFTVTVTYRDLVSSPVPGLIAGDMSAIWDLWTAELRLRGARPDRERFTAAATVPGRPDWNIGGVGYVVCDALTTEILSRPEHGEPATVYVSLAQGGSPSCLENRLATLASYVWPSALVPGHPAQMVMYVPGLVAASLRACRSVYTEIRGGVPDGLDDSVDNYVAVIAQLISAVTEDNMDWTLADSIETAAAALA